MIKTTNNGMSKWNVMQLVIHNLANIARNKRDKSFTFAFSPASPFVSRHNLLSLRRWSNFTQRGSINFNFKIKISERSLAQLMPIDCVWFLLCAGAVSEYRANSLLDGDEPGVWINKVYDSSWLFRIEFMLRYVFRRLASWSQLEKLLNSLDV